MASPSPAYLCASSLRIDDATHDAFNHQRLHSRRPQRRCLITSLRSNPLSPSSIHGAAEHRRHPHQIHRQHQHYPRAAIFHHVRHSPPNPPVIS
ncbi:hypothetical protein U1Q18_015029 [Sarracenia purpurea var. burkii]